MATKATEVIKPVGEKQSDKKKEAESFDVFKLYAQIGDLSNRINRIQGKAIIAFLGPLGVGKSTIINYLLGCKYTLRSGGTEARLEPMYQTEQAKTSHTKKAETLFPMVYDAGEEVFYCDFPGFKDNRGIETQAFESIGTEAAIRCAGEIRSLALLISPDMLTANKGVLFVENIEMLSKLYSDPTIFARSAYLIITKIGAWSVEDIVREIEKIREFLADKGHNRDALRFIEAILGNPTHILKVDFSDEKNVKEIATALKRCTPVQRSLFKFDEYDEGRRKLFEAAMDTFSKGVNLLTDYEDLRFKLKSCQNDIAVKKEGILACEERIKQISLRELDRERTKKELNKEVEGLEQHLESLENEIFKLRANIVELSKENAELDRETPVEYEQARQSFEGDPSVFDPYRSKVLRYEGTVPILSVTKSAKNGTFSEENMSSDGLTYSVLYTAGFWRGPGGSVKFYVKKRDLPDNSSKILINEAEIAKKKILWEMQKTRCDDVRRDISRKRELLVQLSTGEYLERLDDIHQKYTGKKQLLHAEIHTLEDQYKEYLKKLEDCRRRIDQSKQRYEITLRVCDIIKCTFDTLEDFKVKYKKYCGSEWREGDIKERQDKPLAVRLPDGLELYEVDVPSDGTCLFYSVAFAYLLPVANNPTLFRERFVKLFGEEVVGSAEEHRKRFLDYNGSRRFIEKNAEALEILVNYNFRKRLVDFMKKNKKELEEFIDIEIGSETFEERMNRMEDPARREWGDQPEIEAISRFLEMRLTVCQHQEGGNVVQKPGADHGQGYEQRMYLVHTTADPSVPSGKNHYHYLIDKGCIRSAENKDVKESAEVLKTSPSSSKLRSTSYSKGLPKFATTSTVTAGTAGSIGPGTSESESTQRSSLLRFSSLSSSSSSSSSSLSVSHKQGKPFRGS